MHFSNLRTFLVPFFYLFFIFFYFIFSIHAFVRLSTCDWVVCSLLLTECVQTGQDFRVVVVVQTNAAHQELLVNLPDHRTGAALTLSHGNGHLKQASAAHQPAQGREKEKGDRQEKELSVRRGVKWVIMLLLLKLPSMVKSSCLLVSCVSPLFRLSQWE